MFTDEEWVKWIKSKRGQKYFKRIIEPEIKKLNFGEYCPDCYSKDISIGPGLCFICKICDYRW